MLDTPIALLSSHIFSFVKCRSWGGLCNFTQEITHDFGTETKYQNDPKANKVNSVISQLQDIQNEI
jgi:hypothetical protein